MAQAMTYYRGSRIELKELAGAYAYIRILSSGKELEVLARDLDSTQTGR